MTIYVAVETSQGVVAEISVYLREESADKAEQRWLKRNGIKDSDSREGKSHNGTEFIVRRCRVKP